MKAALVREELTFPITEEFGKDLPKHEK